MAKTLSTKPSRIMLNGNKNQVSVLPSVNEETSTSQNPTQPNLNKAKPTYTSAILPDPEIGSLDFAQMVFDSKLEDSQTKIQKLFSEIQRLNQKDETQNSLIKHLQSQVDRRQGIISKLNKSENIKYTALELKFAEFNRDANKKLKEKDNLITELKPFQSLCGKLEKDVSRLTRDLYNVGKELEEANQKLHAVNQVTNGLAQLEFKSKKK